MTKVVRHLSERGNRSRHINTTGITACDASGPRVAAPQTTSGGRSAVWSQNRVQDRDNPARRPHPTVRLKAKG